jgi:N-acetylglutamate synthase-like GNAT family acetyltransferase
MTIIVSATEAEVDSIRQIYSDLHRPVRARLILEDYLVAIEDGLVKGCAAVQLVPLENGHPGYLYGLAVRKPFQKQGIGRALTEARVERILGAGGYQAVALAMFWNVNFFRRLGFVTVRRDNLPLWTAGLSDFQELRYRRSAVVSRDLCL